MAFTPILIFVLIFIFSVFAVIKERILLPIIVIYSFLPLRVFSEFVISLPGLGNATFDSLIAIAFIVVILTKSIVSQNSRTVKLSSIYLTWLFFGFAFLSASFIGMTGEPNGMKMLLRLIFPPMVFILTVSEYKNAKQIEKVYLTMLITGSIISLWIVFEIFSGKNIWSWSAGINRLNGLGSISDHAFLMALLTIAAYSQLRHGKNVILSSFFVILFGTQVFLTVTRGAIFGLFISLTVVEMISIPGKIIKKATIATCIILVLFVSIIYYEPLNQRVFASHYVEYSYKNNRSTASKLNDSFEKSGRKQLWSNVIKKVAISYHLIIGYGVGKGDVDAKQIGGVPHNEYLRIFYEMGTLGLILYLLMLLQIWGIVYSSINMASSEDSQKVFVSFCVGMLVLYTTGALVDNMINKYKNMGAPLYMSVGFVLVLLSNQKERQEADKIHY